MLRLKGKKREKPLSHFTSWMSGFPFLRSQVNLIGLGCPNCRQLRFKFRSPEFWSPTCPFTRSLSSSAVSYILYSSSPQTSKSFSSNPLLADDLASYLGKNIEVCYSHIHQPDSICAHVCWLPSCYYRWWFKNTPTESVTFKEFSKRGMYIFSPQLGLTDFFLRGFPRGSAGKESTCNAGDLSSIPGLGRSPGERNGYPLQYSGLENSMDCVVHGVTKSQTWLSDVHFSNRIWRYWGCET